MSIRFSRAKRVVAGILATGAAFALAACSTGTSGEEAPADGGSIVLVHDQQAGDGSVIDSQIRGITDYAEEMGWEASNVYVADAANYESTLTNVAETGPDIIVTSFYRITDAFNSVAAAYPDIKFLHVYADPEDPAIPNLLTVGYDSYKLMYASGVLAAAFSETGKVGMVLGDTQPLIAADYNAFKAGALATDPSIEVTYGVVGNYDDAAKAQEVAEQLFASGVDVIQTDAGGADAGTVAAAQASPGRFLIGSSLGLMDTAPEVILAIAGLDFGDSVLETLPVLTASDFAGGHYSTGVGLAMKLSWPAAAPTDEVADRWTAAKALLDGALPAIEDGTTEIPFETEIQ